MSDMSFQTIATSKPFRFLVGENEKEFYMHTGLAAHLSKRLQALVSGRLKEAREGFVQWPHVDEETFSAFCQFAYTGDYQIGMLEDPTSDDTKQTQDTVFEANPVEHVKLERFEKDDYGGGDTDDWLGWDKPINAYDAYDHSSTTQVTLWDQFNALEFKVPNRHDIIETSSFVPKTSHSNLLLAHARLYVLADYEHIDTLMMLSLNKLHQSLIHYNLTERRIGDMVALVDYCFENTVDKDNTEDALRSLLTMYIACNVELFWKDPSFQDLLSRSADLSKAIIGQLIKRI